MGNLINTRAVSEQDRSSIGNFPEQLNRVLQPNTCFRIRVSLEY